MRTGSFTAKVARYRPENRLDLSGAGGAIIANGVLGSRQGGSITFKGEGIPYQPTNTFREEVANFVQAMQQRREPRATLEDGWRNVYIMEAARDSSLLHPL